MSQNQTNIGVSECVVVIVIDAGITETAHKQNISTFSVPYSTVRIRHQGKFATGL